VIAIFGVREIPEIELMLAWAGRLAVKSAQVLRASVGGLKAGVIHNDEINVHADASVEQSLVPYG
jgi:hypothetical protein